MPDLQSALKSILDNEKKVATESYTYWRKTALFSRVAAIGGLAMEQGESSFDPQARGDKVRGEPTAFGPFQHHLPRILTMAAPPPKGCGIDIRNATHLQQLEATHWEITQGPYAKVGKLLAAVTTLEESVETWIKYFEQSKEQDRDYARRLPFAQYWASVFPA